MSDPSNSTENSNSNILQFNVKEQLPCNCGSEACRIANLRRYRDAWVRGMINAGFSDRRISLAWQKHLDALSDAQLHAIAVPTIEV